MSLHAELTAEARERVRKQQLRSRMASLVLSAMVIALIAAVLALIAIPTFIKETPTIVTYNATQQEDIDSQQRRVATVVPRTPSAPSSAMAKVIAANTASATAVPVPDIAVETPSLDFGDGDDFGSGWGDDAGFAEGMASFFGQQTNARHIAYVIDLSMSMRGRRDRLMRQELTRSIMSLPPGVHYQLIFFAGPSWVAGDTVEMPENRRTAVVHSGDRRFQWESRGGWQPRGTRQRPEWIPLTESNREISLTQIREAKLVWGTNWEPALDMAFSLNPRPDVIYFMTDGVVRGDPMAVARRIGNRARTQNTVIHTVALMEPQAEAAMVSLASRSGGVATMIGNDGKPVVLGTDD